MSNRNSEHIRATSHRQTRPHQRRRVWWITGATLGAVALLAAAVVIRTDTGRSAAAPPTVAIAPDPSTATSIAAPAAKSLAPGPDQLAVDFTEFESKLHAVAGIAIGAVGSAAPPIILGDWRSGPAWSTIKVPLAIAALRNSDPPTVTDNMDLAITESDNAAAESIWASLGDPVSAAHRVEDVLGPTGDPTIVQSQRVRPPYTPFGQTDWSLTRQVQFISSAVCDAANEPILNLMRQIESGQSWGIGTIGGTRFKGGWGPSAAGAYLVRQFGVLTTPNGMIAVAMAAEPASGQFDDGTADLTEMAKWLTDHLEVLPTGQCRA